MSTLDEIYGGNSAFLRAADLAEAGGKAAFKISDYEIAEKPNNGGKQVVLYFSNTEKKFGLNKINAERIAAITGSRDPNGWQSWTVGIVVEKVNDPQGRVVDGLRIHPHWARNPQGKEVGGFEPPKEAAPSGNRNAPAKPSKTAKQAAMDMQNPNATVDPDIPF